VTTCPVPLRSPLTSGRACPLRAGRPVLSASQLHLRA